MSIVHKDLRISGKVQGVWYRKSAVVEAQRLGVAGYAMNMPDGTVRIEVEGPPAAVDLFIAWCRTGPAHARVQEVEVSDGPMTGFAFFETRR